MAENLTAWLDRLEAAHKAATPGEWEALPGEGVWWGESESTDYGTFITMDVDDAHATSIVATHNALPQLIAAVRGVLALADEADERVRATVPASAASTIIARGSHMVGVAELRAVITGGQS